MVRERWSWLVVLLGWSSSACVGEAPALPEMTGLGSTGTTSEGTLGPTTGTVDEGDSSTGWGSATTDSPSECGNGQVEEGEECDGVELGGQTCESLGHVPGALGCAAGCTYDISGCAPPGMVVVPGGEFEMGSNENAEEQPIRQVYVDAFYIDRMEVTVADYAVCVGIGVCSEPEMGGGCNWMVAGREEHPVNCVTWFDAASYCGWAGGGTKRLPTEAEWEKAARGTDARKYSWGDAPEPNCAHVVMNDAAAGGDGCGNGSTMEVGSKPLGESPYGAQNMAGNVWEWVSDWYASGYDAAETDNPTGPATGTLHVLRGGSWSDDIANFFRAAYRVGYPSGAFYGVGFRCSRTPPAAL